MSEKRKTELKITILNNNIQKKDKIHTTRVNLFQRKINSK